MMQKFILYVLICLTFYPADGQDLNAEFTAANTAYANANYTEAVAKYTSIINQEKYSAELYHNLGNAYFQLGKKGESMLAYERGLLLKPGHAGILLDREVVKREIESDIFEVKEFLPIRLWKSFTLWLSPNAWVVLQLLSLVFIIYFFSQRWLKPHLDLPRWLTVGKSVAALLGLVSTLVLLSIWYTKTHSENAVILKPTSLYIGPDERSGEGNPINEGEKVQILETYDGWWKVKLLNLEEGYISQEKAAKI